MSKEDFIAAYCERSGVTWAELSKYEVALPCGCDYEGCDGWAMIPKNERAISEHMQLSAPDYAGRSNTK